MGHVSSAADFVADAERTRWHDEALWFVRAKRDRAADQVPDWEALRDEAAGIKRAALPHLAELWTEFEREATAAGAVVHWAEDAAEHNARVESILKTAGARKLVKSKSMLSEECGLNAHLEARGFEIIDSDLGERIVQLRREPPSHIVMPAIHLRREEVGQLFEQEMGSPPGVDDPEVLTQVARADLRERFLAAEAGLTGANFAVAETGALVVVTNEGNADLGTALPPLHIVSVGLEKIVPQTADLAPFLRLLARSATGQAISAYTSHYRGPRAAAATDPAAGHAAPTSPAPALHIVIVDNGRSALLARPAFREALGCIRCGACLNTCPVYRRSGGHSYGAVIPGPIGSVLGPHQDPVTHAELPHACSLCGSCSDVCPVRIPLHHQLLAWRGELAQQEPGPGRSRLAFSAAHRMLRSPGLYRAATRAGRRLARALPRPWLDALTRPWTRQRSLPEIPDQSFRELYAARSQATERPSPVAPDPERDEPGPSR